jgi:hypothetical protein
MMLFMSSNKNGELGILQIKKIIDLSPLSLKSHVSQQPVFILKDGRRVSLNPKKLTRANYE